MPPRDRISPALTRCCGLVLDRTQVKLYTGELVLVDLSKKQIENFLIFDVCEILRITSVGDGDDKEVMLEVGVMKRWVARCEMAA